MLNVVTDLPFEAAAEHLKWTGLTGLRAQFTDTTVLNLHVVEELHQKYVAQSGSQLN